MFAQAPWHYQPSRIHIDLVLRGQLRVRRTTAVLYLFSFFSESLWILLEKCLIAVSVRVAAQTLETFLDGASSRIFAISKIEIHAGRNESEFIGMN